MIVLILFFIFQIFFGGAVSYDFVDDIQANVVRIPTPAVQFSDSEPPFRLEVEVAKTASQRARGLMFRNFLEKNRGMLFVFDDDAPRNFWMKNTLIPLDMIFTDASGTVVSVSADVRPCAEVLRVTKAGVCPSYSSIFPARYVLEINAGLAQTHGIRPGSRMDIRM